MSAPSAKISGDLRQAELRDRAHLDQPGSPESACSTRAVICRSTSSGESAGAVVLTWT
jgi:hypothetical protein